MSECAITAQTNGEGAAFSSLDPNDKKSRDIIRMATVRWPARWRGVDDKAKERFAAGLLEALDVSVACMRSPVDPMAIDQERPLRAAGVVANIVRTAVAMEGQNQTDYWNNDKNERLDSGKATERMSVMPQITLRGIADGDCDVLPVSEDGATGSNGVALPPIDNGEVAGQ